MKIAINKCYGGFGLSAKAQKRFAELQGRPCFFFKGGLGKPYVPMSLEDASNEIFRSAFDMSDPNSLPKFDKWHEMTSEDKKALNDLWDSHTIPSSFGSDERTGDVLIRVIEELGDEASGKLAKIKVVEIPDGVDWEIDEYDGVENVREKSRGWG